MDKYKLQVQEFFATGDGADDTPSVDAPNLLDHQKRGVEWMRQREKRGRPHGGVLADDMGLGKTLSMLNLIANDEDASRKTLIVCPLSLLNHWIVENKKHGLRVDMIKFHNGNTDESFDAPKVVVTTYDTLHSQYKRLKTEQRSSNLLSRHWHRVVLDEAHVIKNHHTAVHAAACALTADNRWCITGTPIHNRHWDMYAIIHFLRCRPFDNVAVWKLLNRNNDTARIKSVVKKIVLKRSKAEIALDIPEHDVQYVHVTMNDDEKYVYDTLKSESQRAYDDVIGGNKTRNMQDVLWLLCRLRQMCCHPALAKCANMFENKTHIFEPTYESSKCRRVIEIVQAVLDTCDDKVVLVSQWVEFLHIVAGLLRRRGVPIMLYTGQLRVEERTAVENQFNAADSPYRVLLMSIKCGGVGLNLTGGNHIVMLEPHWNPQIELQAQDRIHRMGQKKRTYVYKMIIDAHNSIERYMKARQDKKLMFVNEVFDSTALNYEDIKKFFSL